MSAEVGHEDPYEGGARSAQPNHSAEAALLVKDNAEDGRIELTQPFEEGINVVRS